MLSIAEDLYASDIGSRPQTLQLGGVCRVARDVLAIQVTQGVVEAGTQAPYEAHDSDVLEPWTPLGGAVVMRASKPIGVLVGPERNVLMTFDKYHGSSIDMREMTRAAAYRIRVGDALWQPVKVYRKSKPVNCARISPWNYVYPVTHTYYLVGDQTIPVGSTVTIDHPVLPTPFRLDTKNDLAPSEALHVSQLGFRPDDPAKIGFLSTWMGDGGGLSYQGYRQFEVIDRQEQVVLTGEVVLSKAGGDETEDDFKRNYNLTDVYKLDFSELTQAGEYRLRVSGIGTSMPFMIGNGVWEEAFNVSVRGLYHQRSGIEIGPPYSEYKRPRAFHPEDGLTVFAANVFIQDEFWEDEESKTQENIFTDLIESRTDEAVAGAWGGYFHAGDWDRSIRHLIASWYLLELLELYPEQMQEVALNIPESSNDLPDLLDEAIWPIALYKRMQLESGGIRGGIDSAEHPNLGEASWQESLEVMAFAPGSYASYYYAAVVSRLAYVMRNFDQQQTTAYEKSAIRAYQFAEKRFKEVSDPGRFHYSIRDARNLAALSLFRLTGESVYHDVFLESTRMAEEVPLFVWPEYNQRDAVFLYALMGREKGAAVDAKILDNCLKALEEEAKRCQAQVRSTAFHWTGLNPEAHVGWGVLTNTQAIGLVRWYYLSDSEEFLKSALLAAQFGAGANPLNMVYTTGLGLRSPKHPFIRDQRISGQKPPPGITVYGPYDVVKFAADDWTMTLLAPYVYPEIEQWPSVEAYFDIYDFPFQTEFTIDECIAPNAYVWGHLAARKNLDKKGVE